MAQQRPDKQDQVTGMFSKIAKEANRREKQERKAARNRGEFYKLDHPELLSIPEQEKYYAEKQKWEKGGDQYNKVYNKESADFPYAYKFRTVEDK
jgi:hypothetical protein